MTSRTSTISDMSRHVSTTTTTPTTDVTSTTACVAGRDRRAAVTSSAPTSTCAVGRLSNRTVHRVIARHDRHTNHHIKTHRLAQSLCTRLCAAALQLQLVVLVVVVKTRFLRVNKTKRRRGTTQKAADQSQSTCTCTSHSRGVVIRRRSVARRNRKRSMNHQFRAATVG